MTQLKKLFYRIKRLFTTRKPITESRIKKLIDQALEDIKKETHLWNKMFWDVTVKLYWIWIDIKNKEWEAFFLSRDLAFEMAKLIINTYGERK